MWSASDPARTTKASKEVSTGIAGCFIPVTSYLGSKAISQKVKEVSALVGIDGR
jgi:hypothetical protein